MNILYLGGTDLFQGEYTQVNNLNILQNFSTNVFQSGSFQASSTVDGLKNTLDYDQLMTAGDSGSRGSTGINPDFRTLTPGSSATSIDYTQQNQRIEGRVNLGNPGSKNTSTSYVIGNTFSEKGLDKINALPLYQSENVETERDINDLVKFRIGVVNNNNPALKTYIHFRALIDSFEDSYDAEWESKKYMGRGEPLYNYQGFDRTINLSWTVAAQSKQELIPMYKKLNYLASVCAPDYSNTGYMRGNLIELTVGGWCYQQMGIMQGITLGVPQESPWEIGINDSQINTDGFDANRTDPSVKELPMIVKVSGFSFKPIQNFVPNKQINTFIDTGEEGPDVNGTISGFGPQRFISLSNGSNRGDNNYDRVETI